MGRYKTTRQVAMKIDYKLYEQILGIKTPKKSFRQASKEYAEEVEIMKWKLKKHRL